jgi:hypothetical protein
MGYTTTFNGRFTLDKPLAAGHAEYLKRFAETRRMKRADYDASKMPDPARELVGLPLGGPDAPYFTGGIGDFGQGHDKSVRGHGNRPPEGQPGLWCQWVPTEDYAGIEWDGGEKFYHYVEWLQYLMDHFLSPWGYSLSGEVSYQGESSDDCGVIRVVGGKATTALPASVEWASVSDNDKTWIGALLREGVGRARYQPTRAAIDAALRTLGLGNAS